MLTVEVYQVVFEFLMQERVAAMPQRLLQGWNQVVFVVVDPDLSSWKQFDLCKALPADFGFLQNTTAF